MESTRCVQGQAEGSRGQQGPGPMSGELWGPGEPGGRSASPPSSGDLPPLATTSNSSPAHSASPSLQHSSHLHDQAIASVPDQFLTSSLF